jgi:TonB family protein
MRHWFSQSVVSYGRALTLFSLLAISFAHGQDSSAAGTAPPRRVKVAADAASALVVHKEAIQYPEAARQTGIQGTVVLNIVTSEGGDVKEVTIASGDPTLAATARDSVKKWKYKPYLVDGVPVEMETEVSISFHLKTAPMASPPPLGTFRDGNYANEYFGLSYPISRDWVRATDLMRKNYSAEGITGGVFVLLAAVHIPEHTTPPEADSSFIVIALESSPKSATLSCDFYLQNLANELQSKKEAQQKGETTTLSLAGHDFRRADFEFRSAPRNHAIICTQVKDYLLQWNVAGVSKNAVQSAVSTMDAIAALTQEEPTHAQQKANHPNSQASSSVGDVQTTTVRVVPGVEQGLKIKSVAPIYPEEAKYRHIQGSVHLKAVINKTGDVVDLEVADGPIELVVSAVNAVRQWKYRPYMLQGQPVEVSTTITVNYVLSGV